MSENEGENSGFPRRNPVIKTHERVANFSRTEGQFWRFIIDIHNKMFLKYPEAPDRSEI